VVLSVLAHRRRGFSMIEVIVVVVLLGIAAGVVLPRLVGTGVRQAELEAESLRVMLAQVAQREGLGGADVLLRFTPAENDPAASGGRFEAFQRVEKSETADPNQPEWVPARLIRPVVLTFTSVAGVAVDGLPARVGAVMEIPLGGGASGGASAGGDRATRPGVSVLLRRITGAETLIGQPAEHWQVDLPPGELQARMSRVTSAGAWRPGLGRAVDLDATGRRTQPW
jgi:prepilin-type N-terminal cleavage/methylation domain-containing protein